MTFGLQDFAILKDLFSDDVVISLKDPGYANKTKTAELSETDSQNKTNYSITINGIPDKTIIVKTDRFPVPKFRNSNSECKRADFVIISCSGSQKWIIYIELKKGKHASEKEIICQLRGSKCLVSYFKEIGREFWKIQDFLSRNHYKQRFVSIRKIGIPKRSTRLSPKHGIHDSPEKMLKISGGKTFYFGHLCEE